MLVCHLAIALGNDGRRLAHREDDGDEAHEAPALRRRVRRKPPRPSRFSSLSTSAFPVSTTHTITGAIVGVGTAQRFSAVRWGIARRVVWAWVLTIPMSAIVGAVCYWLIAVVR